MPFQGLKSTEITVCHKIEISIVFMFLYNKYEFQLLSVELIPSTYKQF